MATGFESPSIEDYYRNQIVALRGLASDIGAATASGGAATLNDCVGKVTTEALTTAAGDTPYTLTLTNDQIAAADIVLATVADGSNSAGTPLIGRIEPAAGSCTIEVFNKHASAALNGTLVISFVVIKSR